MLAFNFGQLVAQMTKKAVGPIPGGSFDDSPFHGPQTPRAPRGPSWARGTGHHDKVKFNDPTPAPRIATPAAPSWQTTMQSTVPGMPAQTNVLKDLGPNQMPMSTPSFATYTPTSPRDFGAGVAEQIASSPNSFDPVVGTPGLDNGLSPDAIAGMDVANAQLRGGPDELILPSPPGGFAPQQQPKRLIPNVIAKSKPFSVNTINQQASPPASMAQTPSQQDYTDQYNAWRASQGLTSGGPNGNIPGVPLQQFGGGEPAATLPPGVR